MKTIKKAAVFTFILAVTTVVLYPTLPTQLTETIADNYLLQSDVATPQIKASVSEINKTTNGIHLSLSRQPNSSHASKNTNLYMYNDKIAGIHGGNISLDLKRKIENSNEDNTHNTIKECSMVFKQSHLMEVNYLGGRTGNQLFGLLTLLATASMYCYTPVLTNFKSSLCNVFDLDCSQNVTNSREGWRTFSRSKCVYYPEINRLDTVSNWTLSGYFQSWKYFSRKEKYVRALLKFKPNIIEPAQQFLKSMNLTNRVNIFVHVRRGDFLDKNKLDIGYVVANRTFLAKALNFFTNKYKSSNVSFIFVSNDLDWCRRNMVGDNIFFSPFASDKMGAYKDLALMSLCHHGIVTSGTFGWMGAWLNEGETVYFSGFPRPDSWLANQTNRADYYLPQWHGME